jgi:hypothetical protein
MSDSLDASIRNLNDCGCCEGIREETPAVVSNRPGLSAIVYRVGTHAQFKQSMLARLSNTELPALQELKTRDDDDFSIALIDAWATVSDVLTFYQERIANEAFLRTATERRSLIELARLIGYRPRSGVAASTYFAFTLEDAQGAPKRATIDLGTKVQSIPGPGEQPQIFETIEKIDARAEWNALKPRMTEPFIPQAHDTQVYLKGVTTGLKPGDGLLLIGSKRENDPKNDNWDYRTVQTVTTDQTGNYTVVTWSEGLGSPYALPAANPKVYALRQRAALFGYNAPDWRAMPDSVKKGFLGREPKDTDTEWPDFNIFYSTSNPPATTDTVYLDAIYPKIVESASAARSWVVLTIPEYVEVYEVQQVADDSQSNFTLSAKTTRLKLTGENLNEEFANRVRDTVVIAQSELLEIVERPLISPISGAPSETLPLDQGVLTPVEGSQIVLPQFVQGLDVGRNLIISGKPMRVKIVGKFKASDVTPDQDSQSFSVQQNDIPQVVESPALQTDGRIKLHLRDKNGYTGFLATNPTNVLLEPANKDDAMIAETVAIGSFVDSGTTLTLNPGLQGSYDRATVVIYANVAAATVGESKQEVLGGGDASQPYQQFTLKQSPLTYVSSTSPSGADSTLQVRVNDVLWKEVPSLYDHGPRERVFVTRAGDDGKTTVEFGDGQAGARLATGRENVKATYRKGIGKSGNVKAGQISLLMTPPLGVKGVVNPEPATGGDDSESLDQGRLNAPVTVMTLDRVVSLRDYEDFARAYAGIGKALATWTWDGQVRGMFVTVAGPDGAAIKSNSATYKNLLAALEQSGEPYIPVRVQSYTKVYFEVQASVKFDPDYDQTKVLAAVEAALRANFSFTARTFGQPVLLSEVMAVMQTVPGVIAVDITALCRQGSTPAPDTTQLVAATPQAGADGTISPAELLTLDPAPLNLGVMS